jgi:hypothetical protein
LEKWLESWLMKHLTMRIMMPYDCLFCRLCSTGLPKTNQKFKALSEKYGYSIALHQKAHNELLSLGEPVPETKKVADFLAGITGEVLSTSKEVVAGSPTKNTNFEACQQYLKTIIFSKSQSNKMTNNRSVKQLHQDRKGKVKGKCGGNATKSNLNAGEKLHTGKYSANDYRALTDDQKSFIKAKRLEERGDKRTSSSVARETDEEAEEETDSEDEDAPPRKTAKFVAEAVVKPKKNAGDQFGKQAHKTKKAKKGDKE